MAELEATPERTSNKRDTIGTWLLDLHSGAAWRDHGHDRAFGYEEAAGEWTFDRFMAHVASHDHADIYARYVEAVDRFQPWQFTCDVAGADGTPRRIKAFGDFMPGEPTAPPRLTGFVLSVPTIDMLEVRLQDAVTRLRRSDRPLADALVSSDRAARRQPDSGRREALLRHLAEVAELAADAAEHRA